MNWYHENRLKMNQAFPHLFPERGKMFSPLEIGISQSITSHPSLPVTKKVARWFLNIWCSRPEYHKAVLRFDYRVGINGELKQAVTANHKHHAAARLKAQAKKHTTVTA